MSEVKLIVLSSSSIEPRDSELAARMRMPPEFFTPEVMGTVEQIKKHSECKCAYKETTFTLTDDKVIFPFTETMSGSLAKFLTPCKICILMAATLGIGVERYIASLPDASKIMIADAAASALIEAACDEIQNMIGSECGELSGRFSPGYGDLSLGFQPVLLNELNAARLLGITLNDSLMMLPRKTISALIGVKDERKTTAKEKRDQ